MSAHEYCNRSGHLPYTEPSAGTLSGLGPAASTAPVAGPAQMRTDLAGWEPQRSPWDRSVNTTNHGLCCLAICTHLADMDGPSIGAMSQLDGRKRLQPLKGFPLLQERPRPTDSCQSWSRFAAYILGISHICTVDIKEPCGLLCAHSCRSRSFLAVLVCLLLFLPFSFFGRAGSLSLLRHCRTLLCLLPALCMLP